MFLASGIHRASVPSRETGTPTTGSRILEPLDLLGTTRIGHWVGRITHKTCDGAQMNVKQVIDFLVEQKGEEYLYRRLWNPGDRSFRRASLWGEELHVLNVGLRYSIVVSGYLWD